MLGKQIKMQFGDGKWHSFETILTKTGTRAKKTQESWDGISLPPIAKRQTDQCSGALIEKLTPILKELEVQGRANAATMSPPTVRVMTAKIQKLLKEWAE